MELKQTNKKPIDPDKTILDSLQQECFKKHKECEACQSKCQTRRQRDGIFYWILNKCVHCEKRDVYGYEKRQWILVFACVWLERHSKDYPVFNLTDLTNVLWLKYRFYLQEGSDKLISYKTLKSDIEKVHADMNKLVELLEGTNCFRKNAILAFRKISRKAGNN